MGVAAATLERWRCDALSKRARKRAWTAVALFDAVLIMAGMDEDSRSAWFRLKEVYPQELESWRLSAPQALAEREEARASPLQTQLDRRRVKERERDLQRNEKALAEAAALLVLSKKVEEIFNREHRG